MPPRSLPLSQAPSQRSSSTPSLFPAAPRQSAPDGEEGRPTRSSGTWIHAHCDGGARGNPGPSGYGALIQDASGNVLAELSEYLGRRTNNFAEYSGLLGCLQYALDHGHRLLKVVSDSELMVKQIQGKYQVKSPDLKPLFDEAKRRIARLDGFEIAHALRHKNKDADRLANEAMDRGRNPDPATRVAERAALQPVAGHAAPQHSTEPALKAPTAPPLPIPIVTRAPAPAHAASAPEAKADAMLRGFTRDGVVHILGSVALPDGIFVKVIRE